MAVTFQPLSRWTMFEKHRYWAEFPIIFCAIAWAEAADAACAGAAANSVPQAATATAAPARAFLGDARRRMRETDTAETSFMGDRAAPWTGRACVGAAARGDGGA
ncbi:hypothetical protein GCM10010389_10380 [Streptomyces echinoruber]|uniref:Uncharacterized protein n=1 Tax=Streptomyces echinoruber TaxID=68898 RepID=A0A918QXL8_9ACTN|nr:hypothetical protein GCM10010389_10380 [Streptomyces echinoruber]